MTSTSRATIKRTFMLQEWMRGRVLAGWLAWMQRWLAETDAGLRVSAAVAQSSLKYPNLREGGRRSRVSALFPSLALHPPSLVFSTFDVTSSDRFPSEGLAHYCDRERSSTVAACDSKNTR